jgi:hypothetical protein
MRQENMRRSENIEDRRGVRVGRPQMAAGGGILTVIIVLVVVLLGGNPQQLLQSVPQPGPSTAGSSTHRIDPREEALADFAKRVLGDTEDVWNPIFAQMGKDYREPTLVLFSGQVESACGFAQAASGPFYCPADEKLYIDLSFYAELSERFGAPGDFAQAYVIAHEVGHHVQKLLGTTDRVHALHGRVSDAEYNDASVRLELQADFYAGVWAHHAQVARNVLEAGDIEEGLRAASAIGDDRLQMRSQGYTVPESFTHGTSVQRARWFTKGMESGDFRQGDTFSIPNP